MEREEYLDLYYQMVLIRLVEEKSAQLYQQGKIGGFLHLYIGQEAVSTGLISARKPQDRVITAYRDHGVAINVGIPTKAVIAELLGKVDGISKGRGGSMHLADVTKNFWGGHAIVGSHLPIAAGLALGDKYQGNDGITICMFGDGATNIGYFHEALNLSKVWDLPVLWVCENNQYGMGTAVDRASAVEEIYHKADGYKIPSRRIEGMDVVEVRDTALEVIELVRHDQTPFFLEIITYRFRGHSMGDPERYRKADEVKKWEENDPIGMYRKYLTSHDIVSENDLDSIDGKVAEVVSEAVEFAKNSPDPKSESLFDFIFVEDYSA